MQLRSPAEADIGYTTWRLSLIVMQLSTMCRLQGLPWLATKGMVKQQQPQAAAKEDHGTISCWQSPTCRQNTASRPDHPSSKAALFGQPAATYGWSCWWAWWGTFSIGSHY